MTGIHKAPEWAALLGLPPEASFLHFAFASPDDAEEPDSESWDIVEYVNHAEALPPAAAAFVDLRNWPETARYKDLDRLWHGLRAALPDSGRILVFGRNPLALNRLRRRLRAPRHMKSREHMPRVGQLRARLRGNGFCTTDHFLLLPDADNPKEFIRPRRHLAWLFPGAHPIERILLNLGLTSLLHDGYLLVAGSSPIESSNTFACLTAARQTPDQTRLELQRFDIRDRGSILLFARSGRSRRGIAGRITLDDAGFKIANRNHEAIQALHRRLQVDKELVDLIPTPYLREEIPDGTLFVEEMLPGLLAWQLPSREARENSHRQALTFLDKLCQTLGDTRQCSDKLAESLMQPDYELLAMIPKQHESLRALTQETLQAIHERLVDKHLHLTPSHGDFGLGNLMATPDSGDLTGVIDWGTARFLDLAGIDAANMALQQYSAEQQCDLPAAALALLQQANSGSTTNDRNIPYTLTLALAVARFITRDAPHPRILARRADEYQRALDITLRHLDEPQAPAGTERGDVATHTPNEHRT